MIWSESGGGTHGSLEITRALMYSCNYFFYTLGDEMDIELMDEVAINFGLGEPTGVELPEVTGTRANKETKKKLYTGSDQNWNPGDALTAAIGQSDNRFTTMQLAVYAATLASHGTRYKATFMNRIVSSDYRELLAENTPKVVSKMELNPLTVDAYTEGMKLVCNHPDGTGFTPLWYDLPVTVAGKTGTAEHAKGKSDHGAFVCFAPAEDPEIAIAVYVECGKGFSPTLGQDDAAVTVVLWFPLPACSLMSTIEAAPSAMWRPSKTEFAKKKLPNPLVRELLL